MKDYAYACFGRDKRGGESAVAVIIVTCVDYCGVFQSAGGYCFPAVCAYNAYFEHGGFAVSNVLGSGNRYFGVILAVAGSRVKCRMFHTHCPGENRAAGFDIRACTSVAGDLSHDSGIAVCLEVAGQTERNVGSKFGEGDGGIGVFRIRTYLESLVAGKPDFGCAVGQRQLYIVVVVGIDTVRCEDGVALRSRYFCPIGAVVHTEIGRIRLISGTAAFRIERAACFQPGSGGGSSRFAGDTQPFAVDTEIIAV